MKNSKTIFRAVLEALESRRMLTMYSVDLGTLGGETTAPTDINASGQIVGASSRADGNAHAFLWQNGVMTDLGTLGGNFSKALGMNDAGQVVGFSAAANSQSYRAFLVTPEDTDGNGKPDRWYRDTNADGKNDLMRDLGTIGANYTNVYATDVNNLGQVVGDAVTTSSISHAFRWQNGVMTDMGTFGGLQSNATAINDAGQITGSFINAQSDRRAFVWKAGVVTDLGFSNYGKLDINASGQIVDYLPGRVWTPTVANGSTGTFAGLGQLPPADPYYPPEYVSVDTAPESINGAGQVVGSQVEAYYSEVTNENYVYRGMRWINRVPQELPLGTATAINDAGWIVGVRSARSLLLTDDNFALPLLTISGASVTEGNSGTTNAVFTVSLSKASTQTVTVHYATADDTAISTATAGQDYLATSGTLTFAPGQMAKTVSVAIIGERIPDGYLDETFSVALSNPSSNALVAGTAATGSIHDDEPRISGGAGPTVLEGNSGSKISLRTVNLSIAYDQPVTVSYATTDQTAIAGSDYIATSGTLTFAPGETSKQFPVSILGDHVAEADVTESFTLNDIEYFGITLSSPTGNASVIGRGSVSIEDDEPRVTITSYLNYNNYVVVTEPASGTIDLPFTIGLSAAYDQDVVVQYKAYPGGYEGASPATPGIDFVDTFGSVRIPAGQTSATITVPIIGDTMAEGVEEFQMILNGTSGNSVIEPSAAYVVVDIRDNDGTVKTWIGPATGGNWSNAANWSPGGVPTESNAVYISGKSINLSASATIDSLTLTGGGSLAIASNGGRVLRASTLFIDGNSKLNLNDNDLILDYTGASPIGYRNGAGYSGVAGLIQSGRNGGAWNGSGIITGMPAARDPGASTTLAVAEAAAVLSLSGSQTALWHGQTVDASTVLIEYTRGGDANLDRKVDTLDFNALAANFGGTNNTFSQADFNYDGLVDTLDFNTLAAQFGKSLPSSDAAIEVAAPILSRTAITRAGDNQPDDGHNLASDVLA